MTERLIELERADAAREALGKAADMLETQATNDQYRKAFKRCAALLRKMRETFVAQKVTDDDDRI